MHRTFRALAIVAGAVLSAHADWLLNDYATAAADSGKADTLYDMRPPLRPEAALVRDHSHGP